VETRQQALTKIRRSRGRQAAVALALLMQLALPAGPACALNFEEWVPELTVTPFVSERMEYETNVFQTATGAKGSMISRTTPGLLVEYGRGTLQLGAGYKAEFVEYFNLPGQDTVNLTGVVQAKLALAKLQLLFRDDYVQTTVPPGTELTGPIQSTTNTLAPTAEYRLTERFSAGANYTWTHIHFPASSGSSTDETLQTQQNQNVQQLDRDEQLGGVTLFWKALPKADFGLGYQYGTKNFSSASSNRDATIQILSGQLRGDVTSKLSSTFRIGILHRNEVQGVAPDFTGVTMGGGWVYRLSDRTSFTLDTDRGVQESAFETAQYSVTSSATLGVRQEFTPKISASAKVAVGTNAYNTKQPVQNGPQTKWRNDGLFGGTLGLDYAIQPWLRAGLEYSYQQRTSNFSQLNYDDSKISGRITVQF
jgi:hypothetical protein